MKRLLPFLFFVVYISVAYSQKYPKGYFRNPMDITLEIAGSFGELRPNHFHCGIDIRTHGKEGLPVYAAADGWLSRANVSGRGYGNCLYVSHPNGYTTVYAHLTRFNDSIQKYVKGIQYKTEEFEQEVRPEPGKFLFKKGDIIGYSGNTGGSKAPHLHFEIRETITENALNPLLMLDVNIPDYIFPIVKALRIYPKDSNSSVRVTYKNGLKNESNFGGYVTMMAISVGNGKFAIKSLSKIEAKGKIVLAIRAIDHMQDMASTVAPYSIDMCVEGEKYFCQNLERLDFAKLKYINAHTDYQDWSQNGRWFERSHTLPHDSLDIYEVKKDNGIIDLKTPETKISYFIKDLAGNTSELNFSVLLEENLIVSEKRTPVSKLPEKLPEYQGIIPFNKEFEMEKGEFGLSIPKLSIYEDASMEYRIKDFTVPIKGIFSHIHRITPTYIPFQREFQVSIMPDANISESLKSKLCLISSKEGYIGGEQRDGKITGKAKYFSNYWIGLDTNSPKFVPLNFRNNGALTSRTIKASISDDVSGLWKFKGYVDGRWVLFQNEPKKSLFYYEIEPGTKYGEHLLEILVEDRMGNQKKLKYNLYF